MAVYKVLLFLLVASFFLASSPAENDNASIDGEEPIPVWVAMNCCLEYEESCAEKACGPACFEWGNRCAIDCRERCQWECGEWGYGCYECCDLLSEVECQYDDEGSFDCEDRYSSCNCSECCDESECIGGWNETCQTECVERCSDICLVEGEFCECTSRVWTCKRWGPCMVKVAAVGLNLSLDYETVPIDGNVTTPSPEASSEAEAIGERLDTAVSIDLENATTEEAAEEVPEDLMMT